ncbi:MAG: LLM class F420-dependent oxidoreductase [Acidimicrobiia bacterium]
MELSGVGVWDRWLREGDPGEVADAVAELEELGYGGLWIHDLGGDVFGALDVLLSATSRIVVGTAILNLWMHTPAEVGTGRADLVARHGGRLMLGVGVSHAPVVDAAEPGRYRQPLGKTAGYLDELDSADPPVPVAERMLAALGPKMLELARARTAGALPYLQPPEHTRRAREALGPGALLGPEQGVVLERDPGRARDAAREHLGLYWRLPNYVNSWRRLGFSEDDLRSGGSDRLVDALVAWGDEDAIRTRVLEHRDAGANQIGIQVIAPDHKVARQHWRSLAPALVPR